MGWAWGHGALRRRGSNMCGDPQTFMLPLLRSTRDIITEFTVYRAVLLSRLSTTLRSTHYSAC